MRATYIVAILLLAANPALADQTNEDRIREALRQTVQQMRAAQDQAASSQAQLTQAQSDLAAAKAQLDAANAKLAASPAAKPQAAPDTRALQDELASSRQQTAALQQGLAKYQGAYTQVQEVARQKDAEARQATAGLQSDKHALDTCKTTNTHLIDVSEQILHLYESESFRSLLLKSYEPLIGFSRVKLENMVQDYDDKIHEQEYVPASKAR